MERFWAKVKKGDGCWEWTAATTKGYGHIGIKGKMIYAHRLSWELENGKIPDGLHVLHKCNNPLCVKPDHIYLGTQKDNVGDAITLGTHISTRRSPLFGDIDQCGEKNPSAKLTRFQVGGIRRSRGDGMTIKELSNLYSISKSQIQRIISNESWKDINCCLGEGNK